MKKTITILIDCISVLLLTVSFSNKKLTPVEILGKSYEALSKKKSAEYGVWYRLKQQGSDDTLMFNGDCVLLKDALDSFFNSHILITITELHGNSVLYNYPLIYSVKNDKKTVTTYNVNKGEKWAITSNTFGSMVWHQFLDPRSLFDDTAKGNTMTLLNDTVFHNINCFQLYIKSPDHGMFSDISKTILVNKKDFIQVFTKSSVKFQGAYQYTEKYFKSYKFDKVPLSRFSEGQIDKTYKMEEYKPHHPQLLANGTNAPEIAGRNYDDQLNNNKVNLKGKITLLDFWYMNCLPCIKTIAMIEKLIPKYPMLQTIGVNTVDTSEAQIAKIGNFKKKNNMSYPIFLVNHAIIDSYKVEVWPSLYLIDGSGKIIYAQLGINDKSETLDTIDSILHEYSMSR